MYAQSLQETQKLTSVYYVCPTVARPAQPERHKTGHQKFDIGPQAYSVHKRAVPGPVRC